MRWVHHLITALLMGAVALIGIKACTKPSSLAFEGSADNRPLLTY